jgi:cytochrome P450
MATTPLVLRESAAPTECESGEMPAGTAIVIFAPFFHRDDERVHFANRFAPQLWLDGIPPQTWPFIPFFAGPGECPGRDLVLLLSTAMLSALLVDSQRELERPAWIESSKPSAGTLSHFGLRFELKGF